jgi:hypothetical protein
MTRDQKIVVTGAASGVAAMVSVLTGLYLLWPHGLAAPDLGRRLAYALQANAFAAVPLLLSIMAVGNNRCLTEAIDPTLQKEDAATRVNARVVDNTLQQFVLFFAATLALSVTLAETQLKIIPAAAVVFVGARIAFWIGYRIHPLYRAFGMAATGFLNLGLLAFALWKASPGI